MKKLLAILLLCAALPAHAAQVTFQWDTPTDKTGVTGYFVGCGPTAGNNGTPVKAPGANTATATLSLAPGTWHCASWSYGTPDTVVSAKSNEVTVAVPLGAPNNLRFTVTLVWNEQLGRYVAKVSQVREVE